MEQNQVGRSRIGSFGAIVRKMRNSETSSIWRRQILPCVLAAIVGIGVSVTAGSMTEMRDKRNAELQFGVIAENHVMVLQNGLNEYVGKLRTVLALFDSSVDPITRNQFEAFTRPLLLENSAIANLSWVPRVLSSERTEHERAAALQGLPGYRIKTKDAEGHISLSPVRNEYYPIFYATEPITSSIYGLDLRSELPTLAELEHARDEDRLGFSQLSQVRALVSKDSTQSGFLFSLPVYKRGSLHDSIEDRRRNLAGFAHGSFITS